MHPSRAVSDKLIDTLIEVLRAADKPLRVDELAPLIQRSTKTAKNAITAARQKHSTAIKHIIYADGAYGYLAAENARWIEDHLIERKRRQAEYLKRRDMQRRQYARKQAEQRKLQRAMRANPPADDSDDMPIRRAWRGSDEWRRGENIPAVRSVFDLGAA